MAQIIGGKVTSIKLDGQEIAVQPGAACLVSGYEAHASVLHEAVGCPSCPRVTEPGDVEMCVHCWQWWTHNGPISEQSAGALARVPMDPDECIAALDRAAWLLEMDRW